MSNDEFSIICTFFDLFVQNAFNDYQNKRNKNKVHRPCSHGGIMHTILVINRQVFSAHLLK